ncbi:uncharacterized protein N7511_008803 [Penicillium nucicola]|uniref:uncharacterized protein n=1 Tax=Penicillium nucicola TaxID=1850975 RepID=UPI002545B4BB|nr:uncharacterized protein N7511_008803 [Penicillium nucicola]KAJ5747107.1 hypothetical protein N7511_008803 [Penicillium nucicola]
MTPGSRIMRWGVTKAADVASAIFNVAQTLELKGQGGSSMKHDISGSFWPICLFCPFCLCQRLKVRSAKL